MPKGKTYTVSAEVAKAESKGLGADKRKWLNILPVPPSVFDMSEPGSSEVLQPMNRTPRKRSGRNSSSAPAPVNLPGNKDPVAQAGINPEASRGIGDGNLSGPPSPNELDHWEMVAEACAVVLNTLDTQSHERQDEESEHRGTMAESLEDYPVEDWLFAYRPVGKSMWDEDDEEYVCVTDKGVQCALGLEQNDIGSL